MGACFLLLMKDIRVITKLCAVCVLSFSWWSNCLEPRFRSQHSSLAVIYLSSITRLLVQHCSPAVDYPCGGFRETMWNQKINFPITPHSVDSPLVTTHDYDSVSCLSQHSTAWLWQNKSFQQGINKDSHPQTINAKSADEASQKMSLFIWHSFSEVLEFSHSYKSHLPKIKILIESLNMLWLSDAGSFMKDHCWRETWRAQQGLQSG